MAASRVSLRYLVLGLIAENPMSGYDIRQFLGNLGWLIGSPSCGSLYPALRRLLQDGLATVDIDLRETKPPKKVYSITEAGRSALQDWIDQPTAPGSLKAFAMTLILANSLSRSGLIAHLEQRRSDVAAHQARLGGVSGTLDGMRDSGQHLALDYALAVASAEKAWLDSTLERVSETDDVTGSASRQRSTGAP
jgi:PadR family transcriptional regulator AphA